MYQVNVVGLKIFQALVKREMQALGAIAAGIGDDLLVTKGGSVGGGVFCCNDHLVSNATLLHPFTNVLL